MSCKYNNCKICGYKSECEIFKENAELKEEMKAKLVVLNDFKSRVETVTDRFNRKSSQLTKAKEIIKTLLSSKTDFDERRFALWAWKEEVNKAEQFLKEVEK